MAELHIAILLVIQSYLQKKFLNHLSVGDLVPCAFASYRDGALVQALEFETLIYVYICSYKLF